MEFLSEDATYLAGGLGLLGVVFLVGLRVTQQGRFLVWALSAWGLAFLALGIERVWVTDHERIEQVVYALRDAVRASDAAGVLAHLTPDVEFAPGDRARESSRFKLRHIDLMTGAATRKLIEHELQQCEFDFVRVSQLKTHAGRQSRRGTAEFRVTTAGRYAGHPASGPTDWSLGFVETSPKVWKVDRITPTALPSDIVLQAGAVPPARPDGLGRLPFRLPPGRPDGPGPMPLGIPSGMR